MTDDDDEGDLNRFNALFDGPIVSIFGEVKWPKEWGIEEKRDWIKLKHSLHDEIFSPGEPIDPNGTIAILEYSLNPIGPKPNFLKYLRDLNPDSDWPDDPETPCRVKPS